MSNIRYLSKKELGDNSIEVLFCEEYKKLPTAEWDKFEAILIATLIKKEKAYTIAEDPMKFINDVLLDILDCPKGQETEFENAVKQYMSSLKFHYGVVTARSTKYDYKIDRLTRTVIAVTAHNLAEITMIMTMIQYSCFKQNSWAVDIQDLTFIFPFGFANEEDASNLWYSIKCEHEPLEMDNLLDHFEYMKSIRKIY